MKYSFLICDGNGAASRGGEHDHFFTSSTEAPNLNVAIYNIWEDLFGDTFEDWIESWGVDEEDEQEIYSDLLGYLDRLDVSGGDPFILGIKEGSNVIREPDPGEIWNYASDIDYEDAVEWFGKKIADELYAEDDPDEITLDDCIEALNNDEKAGEILYKWLAAEDGLTDNKEAALSYDNIAELCDAATDNKEKAIVGKALGWDEEDFDF